MEVGVEVIFITLLGVGLSVLGGVVLSIADDVRKLKKELGRSRDEQEGSKRLIIRDKQHPPGGDG